MCCRISRGSLNCCYLYIGLLKKPFSFRNIFFAPIPHLHAETSLWIDDHIVHQLCPAEGLLNHVAPSFWINDYIVRPLYPAEGLMLTSPCPHFYELSSIFCTFGSSPGWGLMLNTLELVTLGIVAYIAHFGCGWMNTLELAFLRIAAFLALSGLMRTSSFFSRF